MSADTCSKTDRAISGGNGWPVLPAKRSDLQKKNQRSAAARGRSGPRCCPCSIALGFNQELDRTGFGGNATQGKLPDYQKKGVSALSCPGTCDLSVVGSRGGRKGSGATK